LFQKVEHAAPVVQLLVSRTSRAPLLRTPDTKWGEIASIDIADRWATVRTRTGRQRRLDLSDLDDAAAVRRVLEVARVRVEAAQ
jgi:hypothetical protein